MDVELPHPTTDLWVIWGWGLLAWQSSNLEICALHSNQTWSNQSGPVPEPGNGLEREVRAESAVNKSHPKGPEIFLARVPEGCLEELSVFSILDSTGNSIPCKF